MLTVLNGKSIAARPGLGGGTTEAQSQVLASASTQHSDDDETLHQYAPAVQLQPGVEASAALEQVHAKS